MTTTAALTRSKDRKVTNAIRENRNGGAPAAIGANSFGLPSGTQFSCPGATSFCESICYAGKLEKVYKGVRNILTRNWDLLKDADLDTMVELLGAMLDEFSTETH